MLCCQSLKHWDFNLHFNIFLRKTTVIFLRKIIVQETKINLYSYKIKKIKEQFIHKVSNKISKKISKEIKIKKEILAQTYTRLNRDNKK